MVNFMCSDEEFNKQLENEIMEHKEPAIILLKVTHEDIERCEKSFITLCKNHLIKHGTNKYREWEKAYFSGAIMAFNYSVPKWGIALMSEREIIEKEQFNNN